LNKQGHNLKRFCLIHIFTLFFIYTSAFSQQFGARVDMGIVESNEINEVSGIALHNAIEGFHAKLKLFSPIV